MGILVCAATQAEAKACAFGIKDAGFTDQCEVLKTGVGLKNAATSLEKWLLQKEKPSLIISSGFAGSTEASLSIGSWITAKEIWISEKKLAIPLKNDLEKLEATPCGIISVKKLHQFPQNYALKTPIAVDMESEALAVVALKYGIDFQVLRLITDTPLVPLSPLAIDWADALSAEGFFKRLISGYQLTKNSILSPQETLSLVQSSMRWLSQLRSGWRVNARALVLENKS